ncbi:MAG TPA: 3-deoxy-7-phosphoheptulonate synthase, partial [Rhodocyclaceae bacterium]|nr:3-deoxy-7-phosphoheptulonate synthase [Rhodocyclaceae bacterium]
IHQIKQGNQSIVGLMIESNIEAGNQSIPADPSQLSQLKYGCSVTDGCVAWDTTEIMIREAYAALDGALAGRVGKA